MNRENQDTLVSEQKIMVEVLSDTHIVSTVESKNFDKNNKTGTYSVEAIVDDKHMVRFSLNGLHGEITFNKLLSYSGVQLPKVKQLL